MGNLEKQFVSSCVESTFVSSVGEYVDQFETEIAEYTGTKRAIAVVNGTAALHISLLLAGVQKDDEVLVPGLTFAATANAVALRGQFRISSTLRKAPWAFAQSLWMLIYPNSAR